MILTPPTTDFKISLRKDLNNVKDINVTNVSIPNVLTIINNTNNELSFGIFNGVRLFRESVILDIGNYDENELATENSK